MRILTDVDGVLCQFVPAYLSIVNHVLKRTHTEDDVTEWAIERSLGLTEEETATVESYIRARGFASQLQPYPGAQDAVMRLRAAGHSVYFVTTPFRGSRGQHLSWVDDREHWLIDHFGAVPGDIVHTSAKHLVSGDVFIDDRLENVISWQAANPDGMGLLWYQPYNYVTDMGPGSPLVCHSWDHLTEILRLLDRNREPAPLGDA